MHRLVLLVAFLAGCGDKWVLLGEDLDTALLQVRQDDDGSVWAIGADTGSGPAVWVYDDGSWDSLDTESTGTLWWGWGNDDAVWMVGEGGRVVRYDREAATFETTVLDADQTFFGIWGASADDLWVVGGDVDGGTGPSIWSGTTGGTQWAERTVPAGAASAVALYKVWGTSADDVWIVGDQGVVLHGSTGDPGVLVESGTTAPLFTVHGDGNDIVAVGGEVSAVLLEGDGTSFSDATPDMTPRLNGTYVPGGDCDAIAVGDLGTVVRRTDGEWVTEKDALTTEGYHSALVDTDCGAWAVGGRLSSAALDAGVIAYQGPEKVPPIP